MTPGLSPEIKSRFLPVNDLDVHILEAKPRGATANQAPLLILLHGFPELAYSWRKVMVPLSAAGFHVVAPDQRGYGHTTQRSTPAFPDDLVPDQRGYEHTTQRSTRNPIAFPDDLVPDQRGYEHTTQRSTRNPIAFPDDLAPFRMLNLATDIVSLVHALGHTSVASVIGHDYGSTVAAHCALIRPDLFKSVVLMSAPYTGPPAPSAPLTPPLAQITDALASLTPPRKHYVAYYSTPEANHDMRVPPQGLHAFLRAYYHVKSADWPNNAPHPLPELSPPSLATLPLYYVMNLHETMPQSVARDAPSPDQVANNTWLTDAELRVYTSVYERTGFQGGLNRYRCMIDPRWSEDLRVFSGKRIDVPAMFISGERDWGVYQLPGAVDKMRSETCARMTDDDFVLVDGAGHWVQQEQPEKVVESLLRFLRAQ